MTAGEIKALANDTFPSDYSPIGENPNESQKRAISASVNKSLSIIWGPPGTGKTTAIAKLTEAHIRLGRKVLLLSHANNAVDEAIIQVARQMKNTEYYQKGQLIRFGTIKPDMEVKIRNNGLELVILDQIAEKMSESLVSERNSLTHQLTLLKQSLSILNEIKSLTDDFVKLDSQLKSLSLSIDEQTIKRRQSEDKWKLLNVERDELIEKLERAKASGTFKRVLFGLDPKKLQSQLDRKSVEIDTKRRVLEGLLNLAKDLESKVASTKVAKNEVLTNLREKLTTIGKTIEQIDDEYQALTIKIEAVQSRISEIQQAIDDIQAKLLTEACLIGTTLTKSYVAKQIEQIKFDVVIVDEISMAPQPMLFWAASKASLVPFPLSFLVF